MQKITEIKQEELLKKKRINLLHDLVEEIQSTIKQNNIKGESSKKTFIYTRLADFTYYSEVSVRKFLAGGIPKDKNEFIEGIIKYCELIKMNINYINQFVREYTIALSAVVIKENSFRQMKNNFAIQDLSKIVRIKRLTEFLESFFYETNGSICYIHGYPMSGKTKSVMAFLYDQMNSSSNSFEYIIWNMLDTKSQISSIMDNTLAMMGEGNLISELQESKKEEKVLELLKKNSSIIILDLKEEKLQKQTINFIKKMQSKVIIISSVPFENYEELEGNVKDFSLNIGMEKRELKELFSMQDNLKNLICLKQDIIDSIYGLTGGLPFASLYIAKKIVEGNKYGRKVEEVIKKYEEYSDEGYEELSNSVINETWDELSFLAKKILIICSYFSCSISLNLIADICQISLEDPKWIEALKECYDRGILNHILLNNPRCSVSSLIRTLILSKIKRDKEWNENELYKALAEYYIKMTSQIGECYRNPEKLEVLDEQDEFETIQQILELLYQNGYDEEYIAIDKNLKYYTYIRGYWKQKQEPTRIKRAKLANKIKDCTAELEALCDYINPVSKQKNKREAEKYLEMATEIVNKNENMIEENILALYYNVKALYLFNCCEKYEEAYKIWDMLLKDYNEDVNEYRRLVHQLWYDKCIAILEKDTQRAYISIKENYKIVTQKQFIRGKMDYELLLANLEINLYQKERKQRYLKEARKWLAEVEIYLKDKNNLDRRNSSKFYRMRTVIFAYEENMVKMYENYQIACEIYTEMGYKADLKKFKEEIKDIIR